MENTSHHEKGKSARETFGLNVKIYRQAFGLTQKELAERASLDSTYVSLIEKGEGNITFEKIIALATALECAPADLMADLTVPSNEGYG